MLQHLTIKNFAIIEDLTIDFDTGMTVLTGETGAGKSIIIDAVGLLVGGRGSTDFIRYGSDKFDLRGIFYMPDLSEEGRNMLADNDIPFDDAQLMIVRQLDTNGKNTIKVNGVSMTVSMLKALGTDIVDIHGQNEHQSLMNTSNHIHLLDHFAKHEIAPKLASYQEAYVTYQTAKKQLDSQNLNEQEAAQRVDLLKFQINEIESANLQVGEDQALISERDQLQNFQKIADALGASNNLLSNADLNIIDLVGQVIGELETIRDFDTTYSDFYEQTTGTYYALQDLASSISDQVDQLHYDPNRLDDIIERLAVYKNLTRKYGDDTEAVLIYLDKAKEELKQIENRESNQQKLKDAVKKAQANALALAEDLSKSRKSATAGLVTAIEGQMQALYMEKAKFRVDMLTLDELGPYGIDDVAFMIATNLGEPFKPLVKVASGGELSRLMLAMKTIFQNASGVTAIIFDEVDTGVSGRVAQAIATKMFEIALKAQVLCITHLPQVASMADHQLFISKDENSNRTYTNVRLLTNEERIDEVARMLTGSNITAVAKQAAAEQIEEDRQFKANLR
ncbi:DNA repair protein RecN [Aerococcus urinaeequi]|uniref:DNA repair protein RecN n=1 Tax=Aerococcus urinaeequi TaxID=51665 RepID=UPI00288DE4E6|nr:DNA repair protein RecN [Aerococcus urinaeequi]MDT2760963.1 DNA repair protein RecN [Aerococcus urinaeequi]